MCLPKILLYSRPPEGTLLEESSSKEALGTPAVRTNGEKDYFGIYRYGSSQLAIAARIINKTGLKFRENISAKID